MRKLQTSKPVHSSPGALILALPELVVDPRYVSVLRPIGGEPDASKGEILLPEEETLAEAYRAVERQQAYRAGRIAAQSALRGLGLSGPVLQGHQREPLWPIGAAGSISHSSSHAWAVVSSSVGAQSIGIDIQRPHRTSRRSISRFVGNDSEWKAMEAWSLPEASAADLQEIRELVVFSAKESIFKALYPLCGRWFGFKAVELQVDSLDSLTAVLQQSLSDRLLSGSEVTIRVGSMNGCLATLVGIEPNTF